jgi:lysozyme family protein
MNDKYLVSILDSIMIAEGGYWNDKIGGPTNFGITQSTLNSVRKLYPDAGLPEMVFDLDEPTSRIILQKEFLEKKNVLSLPYPVALFHAHMVVMSWDDGIRIMQKRLGVKADGIIGPMTIAAVGNRGALDQLVDLAQDTDEFVLTRTNGYQQSYRNRFNAIVF